MKNKLQLIGIENGSFRVLKEQLLGLSEQWKKEVEIVEIVAVDDIISFNLKRVPAIAVNGEVIYQQNGKKVEMADLAGLINTHL